MSKAFTGGKSISIASVHQLTYSYKGTLQKRKCRKTYVINCSSKSRQMLFIETAVCEEMKANILTAVLPTLAISWWISQLFVAVFKAEYPCIMGSCNHFSLLRQKNMVGKNLNVGTPEGENKEENIKILKLMFLETLSFLEQFYDFLKSWWFLTPRTWKWFYCIGAAVGFPVCIFHISLKRKYCLRILFLNAKWSVSSN